MNLACASVNNNGKQKKNVCSNDERIYNNNVNQSKIFLILLVKYMDCVQYLILAAQTQMSHGKCTANI